MKYNVMENMSRWKRPPVLIMILFLVLAGLPSMNFPYMEGICPIGRAKGDTLIVNATGGGDYTSIQWAVDNASKGDTINIQPGTYFERVMINKSIRLIGADPGDVFIDGGGLGHCLNIVNCNDTEISNITTYNGDYGIYISNSHGNNLSNIFSPNNQEGIHITNSVGNRIENIMNWNNARGIYLKYSDSIEIVNSTIKNNNIGLDIFNSAAVHIENVSFINNGIELTSSPNIEMKNSSISAPSDTDLTLSSSSSLMVLNSSFDKLDTNTGGGSQVFVRWFFSLSLNNTLAWPIENAAVRIKDNANGSYDNSFYTDVDGNILKKVLLEYVENGGAEVFYSPYNISISMNGYHTGYISPEPEMQGSYQYGLTLKDSQRPNAIAGNDTVINQHTLMSFDGNGSTDNLIIINFTWNFNYNGTPVKLYGQTPDFFFDNAGYYPIRMNITDHDGNWAVDVMNLTVNDTTIPIIDAGVDMEADQHDNVTFNGSLCSDNVGITNLTWTFNYNNTIHELYNTTPSFVFHLAGGYNITLRGEDEAGNYDYDNLNLLIRDIEKPAVNVGMDRIVNQGDTVLFNGTLCSDNVEVENYTWNFHYNEKLNYLYGINVNFTFYISGIYHITLQINDSSGNSAMDTFNITVRDTESPIAKAGSNQVVNQGTLLMFNGSGSGDNVGVVNYTWSFTDVGPVKLYGISPSYLFSRAGVFFVILKVSDASGNIEGSSLTVTVIDTEKPIAIVGSDIMIDQGETLIFSGSKSSDNLGIVHYNWSLDYNGPVELSGELVSHTFKNAGSFLIVLNISDEAGNWQIDSFTVIVNDTTRPSADAGPDRTLDQDGRSWFDGLNSTDNVGVHRYLWTYTERGANQSLSGGGVWIIFHFPGVYKITLEVTDKAGNLDLDFINVTVIDTESPIAEAGPDRTSKENEIFSFDGSECSDNSGVLNYSWKFVYGDKEIILYEKNPIFIFAMVGEYNISLLVNDAGGNKASDFFILIVNPNSSFDGNGDKFGLFGWLVIVIVPILLCVIFLIIFFRKKRSAKSSEMGEPELSPEEISEALVISGSGPIIPLSSPAHLKKRPQVVGGPIVAYERKEELAQVKKKQEAIDLRPKKGLKKAEKKGKKSPIRGKRAPKDIEPMLTSSDSSVTCRICLGVIKGGLPLLRCGCGRQYHDTCALRVGTCPSCDLNLKKWMSRIKAGPIRSRDKKSENKRFDVDSTYIPETKVISPKEELFLPPATFIDLGDQEKELPIDEIFLMTAYGLLIKHYTFKRITDLNVDVLSSMLVAVKNFITDSVYGQLSEKGLSMDLKKIDFGDISVMFACGEDINIVAVVSGKSPKNIGKQLDRAVEKIEKKHKKSLADWDGEVKKLDDVKDYMEELVLGSYK